METQIQQIKNHLEKIGPITQIEALNKYGVGRLASRIHELRTDHGLAIQKIMVKNRRKLGGARFAEYYLDA